MSLGNVLYRKDPHAGRSTRLLLESAHLKFGSDEAFLGADAIVVSGEFRAATVQLSLGE